MAASSSVARSAKRCWRAWKEPIGPAELLALLAVGEGVVEGALRDAQLDRGEDQALDVESGHQLGPAVIELAEDVLLGDLDVVVVDGVGLAPAHRVYRVHRHAVGSDRHEDHREAVVLGLALGGAADGEDVIRVAGVGDEDLLTVDHEAAVRSLGPGGEGADVGPGFGLGHRDRLHGALGDVAEEAVLLLLRPEALHGAGDDQGRAVAADRGHSPRGLLHEEAGVDPAATRAAVLLGDGEAEPAEIGHLLVDAGVVELGVVAGELLALLLGAALAFAEVADRGDEVALLVGELEVHGAGA